MPRPWARSRRTEAQCVKEGIVALRQFACDIKPEYSLDDTGLRVDLKGVLPNGEFVLVECKGFDQKVTQYAEAIIQAASYADSIQYPVFIGPVRASVEDLISDSMNGGALSALHALAGRLNVGFLFHNKYGISGLVLRGHRIVDAAGIKPEFASVWYHSRRHGSKWVRS